MAEFPALPIFTDALLGDTLHLTTSQFGAYMLMLIIAWRTRDCSLPNDDTYLAKITRFKPYVWDKNKSAIMAFWKLGADNKWRQGRLTDEHEMALSKRAKNISAGKVSALKRHERASTDVQQPFNEPLTLNPNPNKPSVSPLEASVTFEEFWRLFPVQTGRGFALPAYQKALAITDHKTIMAALKKQLPALAKQKFPAANPSKWLLGECWADAPPKGFDIDQACRDAIL